LDACQEVTRTYYQQQACFPSKGTSLQAEGLSEKQSVVYSYTVPTFFFYYKKPLNPL